MDRCHERHCIFRVVDVVRLDGILNGWENQAQGSPESFNVSSFADLSRATIVDPAQAKWYDVGDYSEKASLVTL